MPINKQSKELVFNYLNKFIAPEMLDMPLPKPRVVHMIIGRDKCGIGMVYYRYRQWRSLHADDYRVRGHAIRYHLIEDDYSTMKFDHNFNKIPGD